MNSEGEDTDVGIDVGVERLLRLLWLFRRQGQTRTNAEVESCGYPDLRAEGSAGRKNFFNDRERLKDLGVAIEPVSNQNGWRVTGELDDVALILTPHERDALTEARLLVAEDESGPDSQTQLSAKNPTASLGVPSSVPLLLAAISDRHPVRFAYGERTRFIDPYRVAVSPTDRWYLLGIDRAIGDTTGTRTFRIDRITDLSSDRDSTVPPCPADATWPLHPVAWGGGDPLTATVRFPHEPLPEWFAMLGEPSVAMSPEPAIDGPTEVAFVVANHDAFVRRVLAIGAAVVDPPSLVAHATSVLESHMRAYGPL